MELLYDPRPEIARLGTSTTVGEGYMFSKNEEADCQF